MEFSGTLHTHVSLTPLFEIIFLLSHLSFLLKLSRAPTVLLEVERQDLVCSHYEVAKVRY